MTSSIAALLRDTNHDVTAAFEGVLPQSTSDVGRVIEAARYSFLAGGKRVRPALVRAFCDVYGGNIALATQVGLAFECLHTYSLIHDDLPCMDDDILRRGQPTCHVKFDECTAVLAGDGLQALAFNILAGLDVTAEVRVELIALLSTAAGMQGMVGGQMWDMRAEGDAAPALTLTELICLQAMKTGALIEAACVAGAVLAGAERNIALAYGRALGALFQITDDLLDGRLDVDLGKSAGKDAAVGKSTFVRLLGQTGAEAAADKALADCLVAIENLANADTLRTLAEFVRVREK